MMDSSPDLLQRTRAVSASIAATGPHWRKQTADSAASTGSARSRRDLLAVAQLGASTQLVLRGAAQVDLAALNAMLSAHRASASAKGFRTAAAQMRVFSTELTALMDAVAAIVTDLSGDVAMMCKRLRAESKMGRAREGTTHAQPRLLCLVDELAAQSEAARARLLGQKRRLALGVARSLRLCDGGRNLARSALIEAAHAEIMSEELRQVATELGDAVTRIIEVLKTMQGELKEVSA